MGVRVGDLSSPLCDTAAGQKRAGAEVGFRVSLSRILHSRTSAVAEAILNSFPPQLTSSRTSADDA